MSRARNAYAAPAWAAEQIVGDVGTKATLLVLANYADENFSGYPSQATIARETEQSERTVRRQLARLEELGLIKREKRGGHGSGRMSDRFYLQLDVTVTDPSQTPDGYRPDCPVTPATGQEWPEGLPAKSGGATGQMEGGLPDTGVRGTPSRTPSRTPTPLPPTPERAEQEGPGGGEEPTFEDWVALYPRRLTRSMEKAALRAWNTVTRDVPPSVLISALRAWLPTLTQREERYRPYPSTWLTDECWTDIPQPPAFVSDPNLPECWGPVPTTSPGQLIPEGWVS